MRKKFATMAIILVLIFSLFIPLIALPAKATYTTFHSDGFETGTTGDIWTGGVWNSTFYVTDDTTYVHAGTYGVQTDTWDTPDDVNYMNMEELGNSSTQQNFTIYVKPTAVIAGEFGDVNIPIFDIQGDFTLKLVMTFNNSGTFITSLDIDSDTYTYFSEQLTQNVWTKVGMGFIYNPVDYNFTAVAYKDDVVVGIAQKNHEITVDISLLTFYLHLGGNTCGYDDFVQEGEEQAPPLGTLDVIVYSPQTTTYVYTASYYANLDVELSVDTEGEVDTIWYNCKNGSDWIYVANQTYTVSTTMDGFITGSSYEFYAWANLTDGASNSSSVFFSVQDPLISIPNPQNITYAVHNIPVQITATSGYLDTVWYNCKNGTSWIYPNNVTYSGITTMTGFANGTSYTFWGWVNNTNGEVNSLSVMFSVEAPPITVTITTPTNATYLVPTIPVQLSASGGGIDKIWYNCKNGSDWIYGSNITYTSPTSMTGFTPGLYDFFAFANNTDEIEVSNNVNFTVANPVLTITAGAHGSTNPISGTYTNYTYNYAVSIYEAPNSGYGFDHWIVNSSAGGSSNPLSFSITGDTTVQPVFVINPILTIQSNVGGTTNPTAGTYTNYTSGSTVVISETRNYGYYFSQWNVNGSSGGSSTPISFEITGDTTVLPIFSALFEHIINGGFETGIFLPAWDQLYSPPEAPVVSTDYAHSGTYSARFWRSGYGVIQHFSPYINSSDITELSCWYRTFDDESSLKIRITVQSYLWFLQYELHLEVADEWKRFEVSIYLLPNKQIQWVRFEIMGGSNIEGIYTYLDDVSLTSIPPPLTISSLSIKNRDCLDSIYDEFTGTGWAITEFHYYHVQVNMSAGVGVVPDTVMFAFMDVQSNGPAVYFKALDNSTGMWWGGDYGVVANNATMTYYPSGSIYQVDVWIFLKRTLVDTWYVDLQAWANATNGQNTGVYVNYDYFNIYSAGGLEKMTTSGLAGRLEGGDYFNLYACADSYAMSEIYWRNLVHAKLHFAMCMDNNPGTWGSVVTVSIGVDYYADGRWLGSGYGPKIELQIVQRTDTANDKWWRTFVIFRNGDANVKTQNVYSYWVKTQNYTEFWVDLWFNKVNASSLAGAEITSYFYGVSNNDFWTLFTGGSWAASHQNESRVWSFMPLKNYYNEQTYSRNIEMVKLWAKVENIKGYAENITLSISKIDQLDLIFNPDRQGVDTPVFEEPRIPQVPLGGVFGVLAGLFSWLISALTPAFQYIWSGLVWIIDQAIYFITGQQGVFTAFAIMISSMIGSIVSFMVTLATYFVDFVTVIATAVWAFFTYVFSGIWGVLNFLLINPTFNVLNTFATILGICYAWLSGTTYVNAIGQTYDFSYLSTMHFGAFSGGVVIFIVAFILGFFLTFLRCFTTMSLAPILEPVGLFWAFIQFIITVIETLINIIHKISQLIMQVVNTLASLAPKPFGL